MRGVNGIFRLFKMTKYFCIVLVTVASAFKLIGSPIRQTVQANAIQSNCLFDREFQRNKLERF